MCGITPYAQTAGDLAGVYRDSAADIVARLRALRAYLGGLDPAALRIPESRFHDLLTGFDIYSRMLDDALHDISDDREAARKSDVDLIGGIAR